MQTISATLSANIAQSFNISDAAFFMLLETEAALDIELFEANGGRSELAQGVESGYREKVEAGQVKLARVELTSDTAQTVKFGYSSRDVDNRKVTSTVSVVSGEREASLQGRAFMGRVEEAAVAAQYSHCQLWNPAASGKRLVVDTVAAGSDTSTAIVAARYASALSTLAGNSCENKFLGEAVSVAQLRKETNVAILGTQFSRRDVLANQSGIIKFDKPVVIPEGYGLQVVCKTVNIKMVTDFQFTEEDV